MRSGHQKRALNIAVFSAVLSAFLFFNAPSLLAQQGRSAADTAAERQRQRQLRRDAQIESNLMITTLEKESRRPAETSGPRLAYMQIKEDFERIQTVHNQMMTMIFSNNVLDYKHIAETTTEIRKRASRLLSNLPLPDSEVADRDKRTLKGWDELDQGQVKPALLALDDLLMRFVSNPVFQTPEVVDVQQASKAKHDLEDIIKLSAKLKKAAEKLSKNSSQ
ncbi:MAG TPA: hypothetical protein VF553_05870 [Pyrinomonadaceae bacterium]|jgi:hypothetical protein